MLVLASLALMLLLSHFREERVERGEKIEKYGDMKGGKRDRNALTYNFKPIHKYGKHCIYCYRFHL